MQLDMSTNLCLASVAVQTGRRDAPRADSAQNAQIGAHRGGIKYN